MSAAATAACFICGEGSSGGQKLSSIILAKLLTANTGVDQGPNDEISCGGRCAQRISNVESILEQMEELAEEAVLELQMIRLKITKTVKKEGENSSGKLRSDIIGGLKNVSVGSVLSKVNEMVSAKELSNNEPQPSSSTIPEQIMQNIKVKPQVQAQTNQNSQEEDRIQRNSEEKSTVRNGNGTILPSTSKSESDQIYVLEEIDIKPDDVQAIVEPSKVNPFASAAEPSDNHAFVEKVKIERSLNGPIDVNPDPHPTSSCANLDATRNKSRRFQEKLDRLYKPTDWLGQVIPRSTPYFPQIGDELVYFWQGHKMYIDGVKQHKVYPLSMEDLQNLPWILDPRLPARFPVKVSAIQFLTKPSCLVSLKLTITDWYGAVTEAGNAINIAYQDIYGFDDFLVLRQRYGKSLRRDWKVGDRFRTLFPDDMVWQLGTVLKKDPLNTKFPNSEIMCYKVRFDNRTAVGKSPWDIAPIPPGFEIPGAKKGEDVPANNADLIESFRYVATTEDWPPYGNKDEEYARIQTILNKIMALTIAKRFLAHVEVDSHVIPMCADARPPYPVYLKTIQSRLENKFYRRLKAVMFDINYIAFNAKKFPQPGSDNSTLKYARVIHDTFVEVMRQPGVTEIDPVYYKIMMKFIFEETSIFESGASFSTDTVMVESSSQDAKKRSGESPLSSGKKLRP